VLVAGHNSLDNIHVAGDGVPAFLWALLHEQKFSFHFGGINPLVGYPLLPWIGIITLGYCLGSLYSPDIDKAVRKKALRSLGIGAILLFILLRWTNVYGDPAHWSAQKNAVYTLLSFINTTKYPPSLLYALMTLGPALLFLAYTERPLSNLTSKVIVFGRVPMFYYLIHIPVIHGLAIIAAMLSGHSAGDMVDLTTWVTANPQLKGYGFSLPVVYIVWIVVIVVLYPISRRFDQYKRSNQGKQRWLSYF
jgi:uncharacterized membrane protein